MAIGKVGGGKKGSGVGKGTVSTGTGFGARIGNVGSSSGTAGISGNQPVQSNEPLTEKALEIARQLKQGLIKSREEATEKLVSWMLREKVRVESNALTSKISQTLQDDPRLHAALERLWAKVE